MYKGKKAFGSQKKCDNGGDGLYELVGKWKAMAKKKMHKIFRFRLKSEIKKLEKEC